MEEDEKLTKEIKDASCSHKETLTLYVRDQKNNRWVSTKIMLGTQLYYCNDCGKLLKKSVVKSDENY